MIATFSTAFTAICSGVTVRAAVLRSKDQTCQETIA